MLRFYAATFTAVMVNLERVESAFTRIVDGDDIPFPREDGRTTEEELKFHLHEVFQECAKLPMSPTLMRQIARCRDLLNVNDVVTGGMSMARVQEIKHNIVSELSEFVFLAVPSTRRALYLQSSPPFGEGVAEQFPEQVKDMAAAARCLALDEWTAAVFHLMRVLEGGIHELASWLNVPLSKGYSEQWKNALDQIEKAIRDIEQLPASAKKTSDLTFYSGVVTQFRWFKDAWRNHVSHARTYYDEREALTVWTNVQPFMKQLATHKESLS